MGAITNQEQHDRDVQELRALVSMNEAMPRFISHHLRNTIQNILIRSELAAECLAEGKVEAAKNHIAMIDASAIHAIGDMREIGL